MKVQPDQPIKHHGRWRHRLDFPCHQTDRERALADAWEKGQREGLLARLVTSVYDPKATPLFPFDDKWVPHPENVSPRDAEVAATIIQWLGTNVGFSFVEEAFRRCGYRLTYDPSKDEARRERITTTPGGAE